jgi:hypothetical protein
MAYGISTGPGCTLTNCSAYGNSLGSSASSAAIFAAFGNTLTGCVVSNNASSASPASQTAGVGIQTTQGTLIKDCTVSASRGAGILVESRCTITGCVVSYNGDSGGVGDGIRTTGGGGSRIDSNHVVSNAGAGIRSAGSPDYTIRNTANGNGGGNYIIPAIPNYIGPIGVPATATSPWANFQ